MANKRLQELARGYARKEIPVEEYRAKRAELLESLVAGTAAQPHDDRADSGSHLEPPWLDWLPLGAAGLALAATLFWILA